MDVPRPANNGQHQMLQKPEEQSLARIKKGRGGGGLGRNGGGSEGESGPNVAQRVRCFTSASKL